MGRGIKADPRIGRNFTTCASSPPSAVKEVGIGRKTHKMMLDHHQQTARTCW